MDNLNTSFHKLVKSWRTCKLENSPYLFPGDEFLLEKKFQQYWQDIPSFKKYIESTEFGSLAQKKLHVGLAPLPYIGDLKRATIFILMLNPGLAADDFYAEEHDKQYKETIISNLHQKNLNEKYPFFALNPAFAWHGGFRYWHRKLGGIARKLKSQRQILYPEALSIISKNLACLELVPYHSKSFGANSLIRKLASSQAIKEYVHDVLVPRAKAEEILIVATRSVRAWDLQKYEKKYKNIVLYNSSESRASHLSFGSRGGKAICRHLEIDCSDNLFN